MNTNTTDVFGPNRNNDSSISNSSRPIYIPQKRRKRPREQQQEQQIINQRLGSYFHFDDTEGIDTDTDTDLTRDVNDDAVAAGAVQQQQQLHSTDPTTATVTTASSNTATNPIQQRTHRNKNSNNRNSNNNNCSNNTIAHYMDDQDYNDWGGPHMVRSEFVSTVHTAVPANTNKSNNNKNKNIHQSYSGRQQQHNRDTQTRPNSKNVDDDNNGGNGIDDDDVVDDDDHAFFSFLTATTTTTTTPTTASQQQSDTLHNILGGTTTSSAIGERLLRHWGIRRQRVETEKRVDHSTTATATATSIKWVLYRPNTSKMNPPLSITNTTTTTATTTTTTTESSSDIVLLEQKLQSRITLLEQQQQEQHIILNEFQSRNRNHRTYGLGYQAENTSLYHTVEYQSLHQQPQLHPNYDYEEDKRFYSTNTKNDMNVSSKTNRSQQYGDRTGSLWDTVLSSSSSAKTGNTTVSSSDTTTQQIIVYNDTNKDDEYDDKMDDKRNKHSGTDGTLIVHTKSDYDTVAYEHVDSDTEDDTTNNGRTTTAIQLNRNNKNNNNNSMNGIDTFRGALSSWANTTTTSITIGTNINNNQNPIRPTTHAVTNVVVVPKVDTDCPPGFVRGRTTATCQLVPIYYHGPRIPSDWKESANTINILKQRHPSTTSSLLLPLPPSLPNPNFPRPSSLPLPLPPIVSQAPKPPSSLPPPIFAAQPRIQPISVLLPPNIIQLPIPPSARIPSTQSRSLPLPLLNRNNDRNNIVPNTTASDQSAVVKPSTEQNTIPNKQTVFAGVRAAMKHRFTTAESTMTPTQTRTTDPFTNESSMTPPASSNASISSINRNPPKKAPKEEVVYYTITRTIQTFRPEPLLCKRWNVPVPRHNGLSQLNTVTLPRTTQSREEAYFYNEIMTEATKITTGATKAVIDTDRSTSISKTSKKSHQSTVAAILAEIEAEDANVQTHLQPPRPSLAIYKSIFDSQPSMEDGPHDLP
jgi:hypothetical protein